MVRDHLEPLLLLALEVARKLPQSSPVTLFLQMYTTHQGSMCGTGDKDGFILDTTGILTGTEDLAVHYKAPGEVLGLNL